MARGEGVGLTEAALRQFTSRSNSMEVSRALDTEYQSKKE